MEGIHRHILSSKQEDGPTFGELLRNIFYLNSHRRNKLSFLAVLGCRLDNPEFPSLPCCADSVERERRGGAKLMQNRTKETQKDTTWEMHVLHHHAPIIESVELFTGGYLMND